MKKIQKKPRIESQKNSPIFNEDNFDGPDSKVEDQKDANEDDIQNFKFFFRLQWLKYYNYCLRNYNKILNIYFSLLLINYFLICKGSFVNINFMDYYFINA